MMKQGLLLQVALLATAVVHASPLEVANELAVKGQKDRKISAGGKMVVGFGAAALLRYHYETYDFNEPVSCSLEANDCSFGEAVAASVIKDFSDTAVQISGEYIAPAFAVYGAYGVYQWFRPSRFERDIAVLEDEESAFLLLGKYSARDKRNRYIKSGLSGASALYLAVNAPKLASAETALAASFGSYAAWRALSPTHIERAYAGIDAPETEVSWQLAPTIDGGALASVTFAF